MLKQNSLLSGLIAVSFLALPAFAKDPIPRTTVPYSMGVVANYKTPKQVPAFNNVTFDKLRNTGFSLVRYLPDWQLIEKTKGVYDFSYPDWLFAQFRTRGLRPIIGLGLNNPLYGVYTRIKTDEQRVAFGNYVRALVKRYRGKQVIWEIWNEPNLPHFWRRDPGENLSVRQAVAEYMTMVDAIVPIIRQEDPNALIIGPALSNYNTPWLQEALKKGLLDRLDGLSVHPYQMGGTPEQVIRQHNQVQSWIPAANRSKPIFFTELGYSTGRGTNEVSLQKQADFIQRQYLLSLMLGIRGNMVYSLADNGTQDSCTQADKCYGLFSKFSGTPKPAFIALESLLQKLKGFNYAGQIPAKASTTFILQFNDNLGHVCYVVWDSQTTSYQTVTLPNKQVVKATQSVQVFDKQQKK